MGIKINFDPSGNLEYLNLVLARINGDKISPLKKITSLSFNSSMGNPYEFSFTVNKNQCNVWHSIKDFRLIWVQEWDRWFRIRIELSESTGTSKFVTATHLPEVELSNLKLYSVEINTEADISRSDYDENKPTIFFDENNPESSLLHRITKSAVNFVFGHIDKSLCNIQRTFSFDDIYIYDALKQIEEEVHCIFEFDSCTDESGNIVRVISAYDLESYCNNCGYRAEFNDKCPECDSTNISEGYGEDTTIFLSTENVLDEVDYSVDVDSVKNCFKLVGGDDLMTAAIRSCNPNGSPYLWYISDDQKEEMSDELVQRINSYDILYNNYNKNHIFNIKASEYNVLINKYKKYKEELSQIPSSISGYSNLMNLYFDVIDMNIFLESELMPTPKTSGTTAKEQGELLINEIKNVSINDIELSQTTADSAVLGMAKAVIDSRYKVQLIDSLVQNNIWTGKYIITNYSDEEDTFTTNNTNITITNNYEDFIKQKIDKTLAKGDDQDYGITGLFKYDLDKFKDEIKKYGLSSLNIFEECCQGAIDILIEQGIANSKSKPDLHRSIYIPYRDKLTALQKETQLREAEITIVKNLTEQIEKIIDEVHDTLDFEKYIGIDLWKEFSSFRLEDTYSNSNYISDGLTNLQLFKRANEFIKEASKELLKSATLQHTISAKLKNIFTIKEFTPIRDHFSIGNWLRIGIDDKVYKLRLLEYTIDFDDYKNSDVTFSDVEMIKNDITDIKSVINNTRSISSSYSYIQHQAEQAYKTYDIVNGWTQSGLDATSTKIVNNADNQDIVYDSHGLLFRKYDDITDTYLDEQLKIINSTIAFTRNNWKTVQTAIGYCYFTNPETGELFTAYGINAEILCGNLIIGRELGIYNDDNSMKFDKNGLSISNGKNTVIINPNSDKLFKILRGTNEELLFVDTSGNLNLTGNITATNLTATNLGKIGPWNFNSSSIWKGNSSFGISGNGNMYFGNLGLSISDKFKVDQNGVLYATNADIVGKINATEIEVKDSIYIYDEDGNKILALFSTKITVGSGKDLFVGTGAKNLYLGSLDTEVIAYKSFSVYGGSNVVSISNEGNINASGEISCTDMIIYNKLSFDEAIATGNLTFTESFGIRSDDHWVIRQYVTSADDETTCIGCGNASQPLRLFTTNSRVWLHNSATTYFSTTSSSDKRLKKDLTSITENYEKMYMETSVYSFRYILDDDKIHYGFMAQDVIQNLKKYNISFDNNLYGSSNAESFEKNIIDDDTVYHVNYLEWVPLNKHMITKTIKRVDELEADILEKEKIIKNLEERLLELESRAS